MNALSTDQSTLLSKLPSFKSVAWTVLALIVVSYFIFHAFEGRHGLFSLVTSQTSLDKAQKELALLEKEKVQLEIQIAKLYRLNEFPDLKDELIRRNLGYIKKDEKVIFNIN